MSRNKYVEWRLGRKRVKVSKGGGFLRSKKAKIQEGVFDGFPALINLVPVFFNKKRASKKLT